MELGCKVVGLHRAFSEPERADLPGGGGVLWFGRDGIKLLPFTMVYASLSQAFTQMETDTMRNLLDGIRA